jgi:hypothetical protein
MKPLRLVTVLASLLALSGVAALHAQDKPNFSGSWAINLAKSDYGQMPAPTKLEEEIDHQDPVMKIKLQAAGPMGEITSESKYSTDGTEVTNEIMGNQIRSRARWDGADLVIESAGNFNGTDIKITDRWSLAPDGKTLTVKRHFEAEQMAADQTIVLDKK